MFVSHRSQARTALLGSDYRVQPYQPSLKIKGYSKVTQEVSTENSVLSEARSFIQWLQVKHRGAKLLPCKSTQQHSGQQNRLYVFRYSSRAKHPHSSRLEVAGQVLLLS